MVWCFLVESMLDGRNKMELEVLRKKAMKAQILIYLFIFIGFAGLSIHPLIMIGSIIVAVILSFTIGKSVGEYKKVFKETFVGTAFKEVFTDVDYCSDKGISSSVISKMGMMSTGDVFSSNDYLSAKYKDIPVISSDVHIQDKYTDSDGNTRYTTIFRGQWMIFDFNKKFKANLLVKESGFGGAKLKRGTGKFYRVDLEDMEFNKIFDVFAQSELEAFYILTPHIMESIKRLEKNSNGKMVMAFDDNKLHVGLATGKDLFEPKIFKKIDANVINSVILGDIKQLTSFVDELNLDVDIFRKDV